MIRRFHPVDPFSSHLHMCIHHLKKKKKMVSRIEAKKKQKNQKKINKIMNIQLII